MAMSSSIGSLVGLLRVPFVRYVIGKGALHEEPFCENSFSELGK